MQPNAGEELARGKKNVRAEVHCGDEVELLAGAFNRMVSDLATSYDELARLNLGLEDKDVSVSVDRHQGLIHVVQQGAQSSASGRNARRPRPGDVH
ncbi:MAG: hypothetical protein HRU17_08015 [Polyangiaceae bacterium]|nr:hypothetical protein [Polyangiaceae bacterium]